MVRSHLIIFILLFFIWNSFSCEKNTAIIESFDVFQWETSIPEEQGLSSEILLEAAAEADRMSFVKNFLVVRNGFLVFEKYYRGFDQNDPHLVFSVSKSFISALAGIAIHHGYLDSLNQKMMDFFPEYASLDLDPRKYDITIRDLLMMRAGFAGDREVYFHIYSSENWIRTTLELPLLYTPGERFSYNTFETHLISVILTRVTGMSTFDFAQQFLFEPLQISCAKWDKDPDGNYFGGSGMYFTPRNSARFGHLYLNDGIVDGLRIVEESWVRESVRDYVNGNNAWGSLSNIGYGYFWWTGRIVNYNCYLALGHGGQFIMIIPSKDIIVVINSDGPNSWDLADQQEQLITNFIAEYILPAIND